MKFSSGSAARKVACVCVCVCVCGEGFVCLYVQGMGGRLCLCTCVCGGYLSVYLKACVCAYLSDRVFMSGCFAERQKL